MNGPAYHFCAFCHHRRAPGLFVKNAMCPDCGRVRLSAFQAAWDPIERAEVPPALIGKILPVPPRRVADVPRAVAQAARYREVLLKIRDWPGDCIDHPASIGSSNPHEMATEALQEQE